MQNKWCLSDFSHIERIHTHAINMTLLCNEVHRAEAAGAVMNASIMHIYKSDDAKNANRCAKKQTHTLHMHAGSFICFVWC